jgi:hypothetical protein
VTGGCTKLHEDELRDFYSARGITRIVKLRRMKLAGYVARMVEKKNAHALMVSTPELLGPLGRPRRRWVDKIKMDLEEWCLLGCYAVWLL